MTFICQVLTSLSAKNRQIDRRLKKMHCLPVCVDLSVGDTRWGGWMMGVALPASNTCWTSLAAPYLLVPSSKTSAYFVSVLTICWTSWSENGLKSTSNFGIFWRRHAIISCRVVASGDGGSALNMFVHCGFLSDFLLLSSMLVMAVVSTTSREASRSCFSTTMALLVTLAITTRANSDTLVIPRATN